MGMGARVELSLLMTLLGNMPPGRPPGSRPPGGKVANCPRCGARCTAPFGKRFYCDNCDKYFRAGGSRAGYWPALGIRACGLARIRVPRVTAREEAE